MTTDPDTRIEQAFALARERYAELGVDVDQAVRRLSTINLSLHCWQGDDVGGFENAGAELARGPGCELARLSSPACDISSAGLAVTGNYPGKARTADELRADLDQALALIPGRHRLNLHASYAETGGRRVERNQLAPEHFSRWVEWARARRLGLDFNPTYFAHPRAASGFTLAHPDEGVRRFWIEHGIACRKIGESFGRALGTPCITNIWIPDGYKDTPVDRKSPRDRLRRSLDEIFAEPIDPRYNRDAVEPKLFGLGSESYVVGSHEFYLGYAVSRKKILCLDAGHFHPTETIADKVSAVLLWLDELLLHVSRGVRWDSDHVVTLSDDLRAIAEELVRGGYLERVHIGLDFFDASINRVAAWVIGARSTLKALLLALLEPIAALREQEAAGDYTARLATLEEVKSLPAADVWDHYCLEQGVPVGPSWLAEIRAYERDVLARRG